MPTIVDVFNNFEAYLQQEKRKAKGNTQLETQHQLKYLEQFLPHIKKEFEENKHDLTTQARVHFQERLDQYSDALRLMKRELSALQEKPDPGELVKKIDSQTKTMKKTLDDIWATYSNNRQNKLMKQYQLLKASLPDILSNLEQLKKTGKSVSDCERLVTEFSKWHDRYVLMGKELASEVEKSQEKTFEGVRKLHSNPNPTVADRPATSGEIRAHEDRSNALGHVQKDDLKPSSANRKK